MALAGNLCYNKKIRSFTEAISFLEKAEKLGINFGLAGVIKACGYLGDPQDKIKVIHVAGTNGKGSVCAFISGILQSAGYRVGLYSSPHLIDVEERIQINRVPISKKDFSRVISRIHDTLVALDLKLTYFEILTVAAFLYFAEQKVDLAILEVGMGGRLDATNVVSSSLISVITNIDLDHTQYLGNTLAKIAREKAAIIKRDSILVTAAKQPEVLSVFERKCRQQHSLFWRVGRDIAVPTGQLGLRGEHQRLNAACALGAVKALRQRGYKIKQLAIRRGLAKTSWPGRLEILKLPTANCQLRTIILDGAHNPAGAETLATYLNGEIRACKPVTLVFGVLKDKDYPEMIRIMAPVATRVILVRPGSERALPPRRMLALWRKAIGAGKVSAAKDIGQAFRQARSAADGNSLVCVCGSLYVVGTARKILLKA